jgi:TrmH family RNA methyltransferase
MGAIFTIPVFRSDVEGLKAFLKRNPRLVAIGTSDKAEKDCFETVYPDPVLLLLGSEREGLSPEYQNLCRQMISIPMQGACDSLNLSIAAGVMLYQIYQQHRKKA